MKLYITRACFEANAATIAQLPSGLSICAPGDHDATWHVIEDERITDADIAHLQDVCGAENVSATEPAT